MAWTAVALWSRAYGQDGPGPERVLGGVFHAGQDVGEGRHGRSSGDASYMAGQGRLASAALGLPPAVT